MTLTKYIVSAGDANDANANDADDNHANDNHTANGSSSTLIKSRRKLRDAYERHRNALVVGNLDREQPFSWQYCLMALVSYSLMLSDVFRTGVAIDHVAYQSLEPQSFVFLGPFAYVTHHLTTANASVDATATTRFWTYKYDSTSVAMRAVAEHLKLQAWSPCVLYKERCDETKGIPLASAFSMIDSLVDGVAAHRDGVLTLRTKHEYRDRIHHYALPWFFGTFVRRTTHAIQFAPDGNEINGTGSSHGRGRGRGRGHGICDNTVNAARRPYSCDQAWTNIKRLNCVADATGAACQASAPSIWDHIPHRQAELARAYPNHTIDFVVLDGIEDYQRGSLTFQGTKNVDVVVFTRIRQCHASSTVSAGLSCTTVAVDDYRYEAATFVMNALDWYTCVGILRVIGQLYAWLRFIALVVGCCVARLREPRFHHATLLSRVAVTLRTVFLIPSQVIIYGSSFPISCYLIAHLIDSPAAYALVEAYFMSLLGQMHWDWSDFFQHCAVSMRTVWVVGFLCHRLVMLSTSSNWSPIHGVPGTAEFSITFIASLTIFAQFRSISFRSTRVLAIHEVVSSARRTRRQADATDSTRGTINNLLSGSPVDFKCLLCGFLGLFGITMLVWLVRRLFPKLMPMRLELTSCTIAPYSAGTLWPRSRLVVSWYGSVVSFEGDKHTATVANKKALSPTAARADVKPANAATASALSSHSIASERRSSRFDSIKKAQQLYRGFVDLPDKALVMRNTTVSQLLQRDMQSVDRRTREIESTVYLINLAVMTDPFTFLDLRVFDGKLVGLYETKATQRCLLLPYGLTNMDADIPIDWDEFTLVAVVNSKDLQWPDLLRCG